MEVLLERAARSNCPRKGIAPPTVRVEEGFNLQSAGGPVSQVRHLLCTYLVTVSTPAREGR